MKAIQHDSEQGSELQEGWCPISTVSSALMSGGKFQLHLPGRLAQFN